MSDQYTWLQSVLEHRPSGFDPYVEVHSDDNYSTWEKYASQDHVDERNVLPNEVVLDPDYETTEKCIEECTKITSFLDENDIPYILTDTGGTGFHVHIFFDITGLSYEEYRGARIALFELIKDDLSEYGVEIPDDDPTIPDEGVAYFNEHKTKGHLIRSIGGKKIDTGRYKTVVDSVEKADVEDRSNVSYPDEIETLTIAKTGYVDTAYSFDEILDKAEEIKEKERKENARKKAETYESDDDGLQAVRNIPAKDVLNALGMNVGTDEMIQCPCHDDRTPSCLIRDDGTASCWGECGEPGKPEYINAIDIMMASDETDGFTDSVQWLCETFDIENPLDDSNDTMSDDTVVETDGTNVTIETENFFIEVKDPYTKQDGTLRGEVWCDYKSNNKDSFFETISISSRGVKTFANNACMSNGLSADEYSEEIQQAVLQNKVTVKNAIDNGDDDDDDVSDIHKGNRGSEPDERVKNVIKTVYEYDGNPDMEELKSKYDNIEDIQEANREYLITKGDTVILTDKGEHKAEELLGLSEFGSKENVKKKADEFLENDPLGPFLDAMNKLHKSDHKLKIWELCSALSAKCAQEIQINSWAVGKSGGGKSHLKRMLVKFLPEDSYLKPNSLSPKALFYYTNKEGTDFFKNKLIFFDEAEGYDEDETITLLRALTDQDEDMVTHLTVKDQEVDTLVIEKPLTVWFTSVESIADEQLKNRFILTNPDSSEDVDKEVHKHQKQHLSRGKKPDRLPTITPVIREMIDDIRENTDGYRVVVPIDFDFKQEFNRRLFPYFYTLIELITKIHYRNRKVIDNYMIATKADFELAARIWGGLIETTIAQQDEDAIQIVRELPEGRENAIGTSEIAGRIEGFGTNKVYRKCQNLLDTEDLVFINGEKSGNTWVFWAGKDRELLLDPKPEYIENDEHIEEVLEDTVGYDEEIVDYIMSTDIEVIERLEENDFSAEMVDGMENDRKDDTDRPVRDIVLDSYPDSSESPDPLNAVIERAEEYGVDEEEFEKVHNKLKSDGDIMKPYPGHWKKV